MSGLPTAKEKLAVLREAKAKPCVDCGRIWPQQAMQLDHVRGVKTYTVTAMVYASGTVRIDRGPRADGRKVHQCTMQELLDEIAKCDVICACCHACRTHKHVNPYLLERTPS
jgi:hypothetical protein